MNDSGILTIPVAGKWFDETRSGTKLEEYREATPYWEKRLVGRTYKCVVLTRGYPRGGGVEGETRLTFHWQGYERKTMTHEHFGPGEVSVFAIKVDRRAKS